MPLLTREQIIGAPDLKEETVSVPEWGGEVKVRAFTLGQRLHVLDLANRDGEVDSLRAEAFTFIIGVVDPSFTEADYNVLRGKSSAAIARVNARIMALSGMGKSAETEAIIKNSKPTQSDGSSTN